MRALVFLAMSKPARDEASPRKSRKSIGEMKTEAANAPKACKVAFNTPMRRIAIRRLAEVKIQIDLSRNGNLRGKVGQTRRWLDA